MNLRFFIPYLYIKFSILVNTLNDLFTTYFHGFRIEKQRQIGLVNKKQKKKNYF